RVLLALKVSSACRMPSYKLYHLRVHVVHVRGVVLVVMDLHGLRVDVRLERVEAIRQGRKLMGHSTSSLKIQNIDSTAGASLIDARQHAVQGDLGPVFLVFGDDDAV